MKIKNLKICKAAFSWAVVGLVGMIGIEIAGCVKKEEEVSTVVTGSKIENDSNINKSTPTPEPTLSPTLAPTPEPTKTPRIIEKYPKRSYGYVIKSLKLRKKPTKKSKKTSSVPIYQTVKLKEKENNWVLVKTEGKKGYIKEDNIKELTEKFVDIDISKQKLKIYNDEGKKELQTSIVSGTDYSYERRSDRGAFEVFLKDTDRYLKGPGYSTHVNYFAAYNNGEGLHDASWRGEFGGNIYKYSGSHGCINLPPSVAPKVYKKVNIGTKVIVHD